MPVVSDRNTIRAVLRADPGWSLYALGDLAPGYFERSEWHLAGGGSVAILLLYRAVTPPVLFAAGDPQGVARLAQEVDEPAVYLHVLPETAAVLAARYRPLEAKPMYRMILDPSRLRPESTEGIVRLRPPDAVRAEKLYADGAGTGESPDFFFASMIGDGVFFGMEEGGELVAVAGTHLAVSEESVAAVGNVYTRRDRRGRGLARRLTSAVAQELLRLNIGLIGLNVSRRNAAAVHVYERLGFSIHCEYIEGPAVRV